MGFVGGVPDEWLAVFIAVQVDNRGSYNRGKAFEALVYRRLGFLEVDDQVAGVELLKSMGVCDPSTGVACFGWSYGGYMTLRYVLCACACAHCICERCLLHSCVGYLSSG